MEKEIFIKIYEIKEILIKKIKTIEDYNNNKTIIINGIEDIGNKLKKLFDLKEEENKSAKNIEPKENNFNNEKITKENKEENNIINNNNVIENELISKENEKTKDNNKKGDINNEDIKVEIGDDKLEKIKEKNTIEEEYINKNKDNNIEEEEPIENKDQNENNNDINNKEIQNFESFQQKKNKKELNQNLKIEILNDEEEEKYSLPKLNFDYDKNINEILNDINIDQNKYIDNENNYEKSNNIKKDSQKNKNKSINNDIIRNISKNKDEYKRNEEYPINYLIKNKNELNIKGINNDEINKFSDIKISNLQKNGYSDLFSFNQDLSNINNKSSSTMEDFSAKKKIMNINKRDDELNLNNNIININTNNIFQSEENIKNNNKQNMSSLPSAPDFENENNSKNSKALRVADIIMKINSNDILYDIITQLYSKDILNQLMSPGVDINLINIIEQTIEKITILENEEIEKLKNKELSKNKNINKNIYNNSDAYDKNPRSHLENINNYNYNYNNFNKLIDPKKIEEYNNHRTSFSFYDKNNSSCYSQLPPKIPPNRLLNKYNAEYLNSEILQNYPKTGKTILGYEKFKRDRNRDFNFERSLRNDNYMDDYKKKKTYNFNISKADSIGRNQSYLSNNRSFSSKKIIFNNYTSPFGDYFDSSLQKGGQSKLKLEKNNNILFKNCRSPVKDYIDGINDVYI